ncbi:T9SS type A sorting domain-containing protein [Aureivirga sp. CE67]|uniref:T9SS type A sorting domain-containing protein n=1 Tax=Aureivirga sp. CE67 TaxID=1788983 RepID=UPI0018C99010|nr:T9SS type A sorting domain-containing protein [Aureivirga sp. CE67]
MRKKLLLASVTSVALAVGFVSFDDMNVDLKQKHSSYLKNSPHKKTLQLSKQERKENQLPPNKYYEREWELTFNPEIGRPTPENVIAAQRELKNNLARIPGESNDNSWEFVGPNNVGGRTRALLFDPNDASGETVFSGSVSGGLWKNTNISNPNSSWEKVEGVPHNLNVSCIISDPTNPQIMYLGTGEQYTNGAATGDGMYKSTDGGNNWESLDFNIEYDDQLINEEFFFKSGFNFITKITPRVVNNSLELYVGVGGVFASASGNEQIDYLGILNTGLYKSVDEGVTWERIESEIMKQNFGSDEVYFIPNDIEIATDNSIWISTMNVPGVNAGAGKVFNSVDGENWELKTLLPNANRVELAVSSSNPGMLVALTENMNNINPVSLYKTNNKFSTITPLPLPHDADTGIADNDFTRNQAFYNLMLELDPNNDNIVYVGGIDLFRASDGVVSSSSWRQISKWSNNNNLFGLDCSLVHADQHAMVFHPTNSNKALFGNDGGVYYANNLQNAENSETISERNKGYNTTQFYHGSISQVENEEGEFFVVGGTQDNGTHVVSYPNQQSTRIRGGDGAFCEIHESDTYLIDSYVYNSYRYVDIENESEYYLESNNNGDFINAAALDHNLDILYANGSFQNPQNGDYSYLIYRYQLGVSSAQRSEIFSYFITGAPTTFKVSPYTEDSSLLLVGTEDGKIIRIPEANLPEPNSTVIGDFLGSISDIEFGKDENHILVTIHNYGVDNIFYTSNGGETWENKEGTGLPDIPVKCILQNPLPDTTTDTQTLENEVIIGTELGVWKTTNFLSENPTWSHSYNGMSDVKVVDLDLRKSDSKVLATTHGAGMFVGEFITDNPIIIGIDEDKYSSSEISVYPNPTVDFINIKSKVNFTKAIVNVFDLQGKLVLTKELKGNSSSIDIQNLEPGTYILNLNNNGKTFEQKIIKN